VKRQKDLVIPYPSGRFPLGDFAINRKGSRRSAIKKSIARAAADAAHKNPIKDFERPRWKLACKYIYISLVNYIKLSSRNCLHELAAADPSAETDLNPELLPFISHAAPAITHRSVAGLGRKEMKSCWKTIKSKIGSSAGHRLATTPNTATFLNDGNRALIF
jgi:hypothetical protein